MVKESCPAAYGYAYDDKTATITCTTSTEYKITFYCLAGRADSAGSGGDSSSSNDDININTSSTTSSTTIASSSPRSTLSTSPLLHAVTHHVYPGIGRSSFNSPQVGRKHNLDCL